ncbi:MAG: hypothetical protein IJH79_16650, partial [Lentisphaeria bacterium]|nr:hypothetical protein [Lentisphaeria bacterium]
MFPVGLERVFRKTEIVLASEMGQAEFVAEGELFRRIILQQIQRGEHLFLPVAQIFRIMQTRRPFQIFAVAGLVVGFLVAGGEIAGYPVVDIKATLYDGSYHDVDSSE